MKSWQGSNEALLDAHLSPPATVNGKVFLGTTSGELVCLSAETGDVLWSVDIAEPILFQPAVAAGRVYVSTSKGSLYCLGVVSLLWGPIVGTAAGVLVVLAVLDARSGLPRQEDVPPIVVALSSGGVDAFEGTERFGLVGAAEEHHASAGVDRGLDRAHQTKTKTRSNAAGR